MNKAYERIDWKNKSVGGTALGMINLNRMDAAIDEIDNRVVELANQGGGVMLDYSYDEQYTGRKWVDGKKIYQRTFRLVENGHLQYTYSDSIFTISDMDVCESFTASELVNQREEGSNSWWDNHTSNNNGDRLVLVPKRGAVFLLYYGITLRNTWVTFQYTKTTD